MKVYNLKTRSSIRLDELLRNEIPILLDKEVSNSKIRRFIVSGAVSINRRQIRIPSFIVKSTDFIQIMIDLDKFFFEKKPNDIEYELTEDDILFEDADVIVVNKPTHFPTEMCMVSDRNNLHHSIVNFLFERQKVLNPKLKNPPYVGIMHRLDRDTSGVILFTKTRSVNSACHDMFEKHFVKKTYIAVVYNNGKYKVGDSFSVSFPMGRISLKSQSAKWGRVEASKGVDSKTEFEILKEKIINNQKFFIVECRPYTGRTHQIRVHLSSVGMPILGDELYGGKSYDRIMLHAKSLEFPHPNKNIILNIEAPIPNNFS